MDLGTCSKVFRFTPGQLFTFQAKETYQRALSVLPHAALPDDKKQNLEQHFREQITLCEKEMAAPTGR